jgi:Rrf2 family protein
VQLLASEEYGLRCLLQVAREADGALVPVSRVAAEEGLSTEYAAKLLRQLRLAGLVESTRGAEGGYRLSRPADQITVWSALACLGGEFFGAEFCSCHPGQRRRCVRTRNCALRPLWQALQQALRATLERVTLSDLQRDERAMAAWLGDARGDFVRIEGVKP